MNNKIKQYWEQGTETVVPRDGDYSSVSSDQIKKFAELIVKECAEFTDPGMKVFLFKHFGIDV